MLRLAILLLIALTSAALARPPLDVIEVRRLDGPGAKAFAKFRKDEVSCGITRDGSKIYLAYARAILSLDFDGAKRRILPLLLTDKQGDNNLVKHKVRVACVNAVRKAGGDYLLDVSTQPKGQGLTATLRVDAEGRLLNPKDNRGLFYAIGENSRANRAINRFALVESRLNRFTCIPGEGDISCEYQFLNFAERQFSDEVRHQSFWPLANRRTDQAMVDRAVSMALAGDGELLALHRMIVANESSTISPFQLWDAVLADSGLSFGPHQWDLGINPQGQRIARKLAKLGGLKPLDGYFKSVRRFSASEMRSLLLAMPAINRVLQSPQGRALVIGEYIAWLKGDALKGSRVKLAILSDSRPEDRVMLLYYADVDNQYGDEVLKADLRSLIEDLSKRGAARPEIRAALDARMLRTSFAVAYPDKAAARLERTWAVLEGL